MNHDELNHVSYLEAHSSKSGGWGLGLRRGIRLQDQPPQAEQSWMNPLDWEKNISQMRRMYGLFTYMNGEKWPHSHGNVGKYSLHGASGYGCFQK